MSGNGLTYRSDSCPSTRSCRVVEVGVFHVGPKVAETLYSFANHLLHATCPTPRGSLILTFRNARQVGEKGVNRC
ncbi:hypothetical protein Pan216_37700 [Planctomycetes bacterium Pan216]|uniref:Uncharacterized protein n=1 Tax=Kolteria novifilia TaxID=2527975 RepID=A0A518B7E2_9BACT|nr:hypothetical protein Pan216_37700 [Planctomycetes bacterium Pan216]